MTDDNQTNSTEVEMETLQNEFTQMKEMAQRALADLQNYKRQAEEEKTRLISLGQINVLSELLPVLDNFTRAFTHMPEDLKQNEWVNGVAQIEKQLLSIIKSVGLEEIPTVGQMVNPNMHEIISTGPGPKDQIITEIEKGYTFQGKVLRASKVIVGNE